MALFFPYTNPDGVQAKEFILPKELLEAECVISLSKMKTHALERITGAVKNSYGFVYGKNKAIGHTKYPSVDSFARMLFIYRNLCILALLLAPSYFTSFITHC